MRMRKRRRHEWNLSFASMSDIAFLLIIFFAVAGKFTKTAEQDIPLPAVDLGERIPLREIRVVVTKGGDYFINGSRVHKPEDLAEELGFYILEDTDAETRTVKLYADRDAEFGKVSVAIEAINQADAYLELAVRFSD
jgi:biopolymer transport protein ExbD